MVPQKNITPSPNKYQLPADNPYFKNTRIAKVNEKKFFEPVNMPSIRARVPVQYTSMDGVTPIGFAEKGSTLSSYVGGSQASSYRKVGIGFGERADFTKDSGNKADFIHDYEKMYSIKNNLKLTKARSSRKNDTFGSPFSSYSKVVVPGGLSQYLGKGTEFQIGLGHDQAGKAEQLTKTSASTLPKLTQDRGLLSPSMRQLKSSLIGPGAYNVDSKGAFPQKASTKMKIQNSFGTAGRDTHFSKYASLHRTLIEKGLQ